MAVLIISTYDLGHQPQGPAELAGHLHALGVDSQILDLSLTGQVDSQLKRLTQSSSQRLGESPWQSLLSSSDTLVVYLNMLTSAKMARELIDHIASFPQRPNRLALSGLYAHLVGEELDISGFADHYLHTSSSPADLLRWIHPKVQKSDLTSLPYRPRREILEPIGSYKRVEIGLREIPTGYVETSVGCRHRCRHCPVPIVFDGKIQIHKVEDILQDVQRQVNDGAEHISIGDPDFMNAPIHSMKVLRTLHEKFPSLTFDFTVKIEHILRHRGQWAEIRSLGCLYVISAVESLSDTILGYLDKGHTARDVEVAIDLLDDAGIGMHPSFLPFTPWTEVSDLIDILKFVYANSLDDTLEPVQLGIRLLVPPRSLLLSVPEMKEAITGYDADNFTYLWRFKSEVVEELQRQIATITQEAEAAGESYAMTFARIWSVTQEITGITLCLPDRKATKAERVSSTEAWFCCAEPTSDQRSAIAALTPRA